MERYIDNMLTPQIRSEKVSFTRLTVLSAPANVTVGGTVNKVSISDGSASVCAVSDEAARQGLNYIRQLQILFDGSVPVCEFEYFAPRFEYRGFLIDVCRHFMPVSELLRIIDLMSLIGFNVFHWHFTEDQGWRFSVPGYPLLKKVSSVRKDNQYIRYELKHSGFYSDKDLERVVSFASERGMTVVPEIEIPGHATALLAAYPEFGCTGAKLEVESRWGIFKDVLNPASPELWAFLDKAFAKLAKFFPGPYIHIGGDECPHDQWAENKDCQELMKKEGLKNLDELQG
ncbi:MAG: family 20 glycosylhydrolase, partial [Spirochaetales bacterium]|nr:family 20 glycosylhydrolase [Spirochaetales bacterium]